MRHFRLRWRALAQALLLSAGTFLISGAALAGVNGFVVVNPIVVCDGTGANCPAFGAQCSTNTTTGVYSCTTFNSPSTATLSTPIGFVDGDTNFNLTRAILAATANIDVAFFPVTQYNSPTNTDPWTSISSTYNPTTYQHLHLKSITCKDGTVVSASPELAALTQQKICTSSSAPHGVSNPPTAPSPAPPLASTLGESNALDVFFVVDYPGQAVFGQSWINGDGVSIGGNATFTSSSTGPGPRFDVLAHEIGHALDLDHATFGAGGGNNLMTTGANRAVASTSGCSVQNPYGFNKYTNTNNGLLYDLGNAGNTVGPPSMPWVAYPLPVPNITILGQTPWTCPSAPAPTTSPNNETDQLTTGSACTTLATCQTNLNQVGALSLSKYINATLASTADAGGGALTALAKAATPISGSSSSSAVPVKLTAPAGTGANGDSANSIVIGLPEISGLQFSGSSPATLVSCTDQNGHSCGVTIINQVRLNGNNNGIVSNPNCGPLGPGLQCLQLFFSTGQNALVAGDIVIFDLAFSKDVATIQADNLLDGTQFTLITSTANTSSAYSTTTTFGAFNSTTGVFHADSRNPDFSTPNQINPNFVNAAVVDPQIGPKLAKCTPPYVVTGSGSHQQLECPGVYLPVLTQCPAGMQYCND
jgi:hypothetical protein